MCVWVSSLGEERPLGRAGVEAGRVGPSLLTSPPGRARTHACISWGQGPPAVAGDIELGVLHGGPPNLWHGPHRAMQRTELWAQSRGRPRAGSPKPRDSGTNPEYSQLGDSVGSRGAGGGGGRGVSVRMSVAVLACWRPISQMIFATIKKCGGVKWQFHIQQGKGGFTWELGLAAAAGGGGGGGIFPSPLSSPD